MAAAGKGWRVRERERETAADDDFNANAAAELDSLTPMSPILIHSINVFVSGGGSFCPR